MAEVLKHGKLGINGQTAWSFRNGIRLDTVQSWLKGLEVAGFCELQSFTAIPTKDARAIFKAWWFEDTDFKAGGKKKQKPSEAAAEKAYEETEVT